MLLLYYCYIVPGVHHINVREQNTRRHPTGIDNDITTNSHKSHY